MIVVFGPGCCEFLRASSGSATALLAMNTVFGLIFQVDEVEAADPSRAATNTEALDGRFIFDEHVRFAHDEYDHPALPALREYTANHSNPEIRGDKPTFEKIRFENFPDELYAGSRTTIAVLGEEPNAVRPRTRDGNGHAGRAYGSVCDRPAPSGSFLHAIQT